MPPKDKAKTVQTILLDLYERTGKIEAQNDQILQEQSEARNVVSAIMQNQAFLNRRMDDFDGGERMAFEGGFKTSLRDVSTLKKQLAVAGVITFGAFQIIWFGLLYIKQIAGFIADAFRFWGK